MRISYTVYTYTHFANCCTVGADAAVYICLLGMHYNAKTNFTPRSKNRNIHLSLAAIKETIRINHFRGGHI